MRRLAVVFLVVAAACSPNSSGTSVVTPTTTGETTTTVRISTTRPTTPTTAPQMTPTTVTRPITPTTAPPVTTSTPALPPLEALAYTEVAVLPFAVQLVALPGSPLSYIATKDGRVWVYDGSLADDPALDIRAQVLNKGEQGLLSIALHPADETRFFAHYTANDGDTVVSEFTFTNPSTIDPDSERVLLRLEQPASNHNGGMIQFGPDEVLFVGLGDGGGANDRFNNGQNLDTLLGGLVTLRVDGDPNPTLYAYGLRNPWRFWIDGLTVYIADVGQNRYEEVSVAPLRPDQNFGWPVTEGAHCFSPSSGCDPSGQVLPVVEVSHGDGGTCSITGGIVYRGNAIPELDGTYFYSDYCGGFLRSFRFDGEGVTDETDWTSQVGIAGRVVGFGVDGEGEMYVVTTTRLLKVVAVRG